MFFIFRKLAADDRPKGPPGKPGKTEYGDDPELCSGADWEPDAGGIDIDATVRKAKAGDDEAFSDLVLHYEKFVFNTACRILSSSGRSEGPADDVAQTAFIKAWRSLGNFRGDCAFSTWLYRITVNAAKDYLRSEGRRQETPITVNAGDDEDDMWELPVTSENDIPDESYEKKERIATVRRAIEALPKDQRQIIVMRDLDELSYQEISDILGIELGTVRSRINRGRAKLKSILEEWNFS